MRRRTIQISLGLSILASAATAMLSQTVAADKKPSFEVVSVKRNLSTQEGGGGGPRGDRFVMTNVPVRILINFAFRPPKGSLLSQQIVGGPDWMRSDRFDIQAKMPGSYPSLPYDQIQLMVQSLLEDRFQFKAHRETRELPVYQLVVANGGLKLKLSDDQAAPDPSQGFIDFVSGEQEDSKPLPRGAMRLTTGSSDTILSANAVQVSSVVTLLQGSSDRIILDKTALTGRFDIHLRFHRDTAPATQTPDGPPSPSDAPAPSLFTAIQELGLKLESARAPLDVVVVDSIQKPSEN
jgi:bla regulator protein blaR1